MYGLAPCAQALPVVSSRRGVGALAATLARSLPCQSLRHNLKVLLTLLALVTAPAVSPATALLQCPAGTTAVPVSLRCGGVAQAGVAPVCNIDSSCPTGMCGSLQYVVPQPLSSSHRPPLTLALLPPGVRLDLLQ